MAAAKGNQYALGNDGGRPTAYKPEYCEKAIELGKLGKSRVQIACALDVDPKSLRDWANSHDEFSLALTRAKAHEQDWWETKGQDGLTADKFNSAVWSKSMSARFRDDYTERREVAAKVEVEETGAKEKLAHIVSKLTDTGTAETGYSEPE